jgi:hypothetical protein
LRSFDQPVIEDNQFEGLAGLLCKMKTRSQLGRIIRAKAVTEQQVNGQKGDLGGQLDKIQRRTVLAERRQRPIPFR